MNLRIKEQSFDFDWDSDTAISKIEEFRVKDLPNSMAPAK